MPPSLSAIHKTGICAEWGDGFPLTHSWWEMDLESLSVFFHDSWHGGFVLRGGGVDGVQEEQRLNLPKYQKPQVGRMAEWQDSRMAEWQNDR